MQLPAKDKSVSQKCLKLSHPDFYTFADWSPKTDNVMHLKYLVKQVSVD